MDELDLLHDPDGASTVPLAPVPAGLLPVAPAGPTTGAPTGAPGAAGGPGSHRRNDEPTRPWAWLVAVLCAALVAVAGLVGMIGAAVDGGDRRAPVAAAPTASATSSGPAPTTTEPLDTSTPTPPPAPTVTVALPPAPSASRVVAPPPTRPPAPTTPPTPRATVRTVSVPDVVGERLRSATRTLQAAGLRVSVVSLTGDDRDNRRVVAQQPRGGQLPAGSTVLVYVGRR